MLRRALLVLPLAALALPARTQEDGPVKVYASPLAAVKAAYDPDLSEGERPYSKALRTLVRKARAKSMRDKEALPGLDFDPTLNAQDADDDFRTTLRYAVEPRPNRNALVIVHLRALRTAPDSTLHFEVAPEGDGFVIADILNPAPKGGWRWSKLLAAGLKG